MTKKEAIGLFGKTHKALADAINRSRVLITMWPDELTEDQKNMVVGAATRKGIKVPKELLK